MNSLTDRLIRFNFWAQQEQHTILFDSNAAAADVAFTLGGQWDGCNGVVVRECDEVAISTAAGLAGAQWCYEGNSLACLIRLPAEEFLRRYATGERNFTNANLRCAVLCSHSLSGVNLSWAKLNGANLSGTDMRGADLSHACLNEADLSKADLRGANLAQADLRGANLSQTHLSGANLRAAKVSKADLNRAIISDVAE